MALIPSIEKMEKREGDYLISFPLSLLFNYFYINKKGEDDE